MLTLEEAQSRLLAQIRPLPAERVPMVQAAGRTLAADVAATLDLPRFDNSAMDGYAVRAADTAGASPQTPVTLHSIGRVAAGESFSKEIGAGECVRLFTGSPLPRGADAVVMQEDARVDAAEPDIVRLCEAARPWEHVRLRGEDVKQGELLLRAGMEITAGRIGLLAAMGMQEVAAARAPVVGLLATGSELCEAGRPLGPGQIYESNRAMLAPLLAAAGARVRSYPLVPDTLAATSDALKLAFSECDVVITAGGVSVGELDFVKEAFEKLGGRLDFWKVAIKPGKPFAFGEWRGRFLFGLPGNPVSALVTFLLLVRPALLQMQGASEVHLPTHPGTLAGPLANRGDRRHFMRVCVCADGLVRPAGMQASHALASLASANALVEVPAQTTLPAGLLVRVWRL
jgi:molybdopterin molybdotransferase